MTYTIDEIIHKFSKSIDWDTEDYSLRDLLYYFEEKQLTMLNGQEKCSWDIGKKSDFIASMLLSLPTTSIVVKRKSIEECELIVGVNRFLCILDFLNGMALEPTNPFFSDFAGVEYKSLSLFRQNKFKTKTFRTILLSKESPTDLFISLLG